MPKGQDQLERLDRAATLAERHARTCTRCSHRIIDPEGNPGLFGEACKAGLVLLVAYVQALGETVPRWALEAVQGLTVDPGRAGGQVLDPRPWRVAFYTPTGQHRETIQAPTKARALRGRADRLVPAGWYRTLEHLDGDVWVNVLLDQRTATGWTPAPSLP